MYRLLLIALLALASTECVRWEELEKTREIVRGYGEAAERMMESLESVVKNTTEEENSFLASLDQLAVVKEAQTLAEDKDCKGPELKTLKSSYRAELSRLEGPLVSRAAELRCRLTALDSSLELYRSLAEGRWWSCKAVRGAGCELSEVEDWLRSEMSALLCRLLVDCQADRGLFKRSISAWCSSGEYRWQGDCYSFNGDTCDGRCDYGRNNCYDEPSGCSRSCVGGFHCQNLQCIDIEQRCNGLDDCGDNSDEENCPQPREVVIPEQNCTLESGKYLCRDKTKCLDIAEMCDGREDCADGSDEGGLCDNAICADGCAISGGVCLVTPIGAACLSSCPPGTSESALGCTAGPPAAAPATLDGLLADTPRLVSRYIGRVKLLQRVLVAQLVSSLGESARCRFGAGDPFGSPVRIGALSGVTLKPPHTTTHKPPHTTTYKPPHTTTQKPPHTTSHEPPHTTTSPPPTTSTAGSFLFHYYHG